MNQQRKRIGIIFNFSKHWMGGVIYIINLINALNFLEDKQKPAIFLFYNPDLEEFLKDIEYPYLTSIASARRGDTIKRYVRSFLSGKNLFVDQWIRDYKLDGVYPLNDQPVSSKKAFSDNFIAASWFPDLQHKFYPEFFTRKQLLLRETRLRLLLKNTKHLVVSSHDVKSHFHKFYKLRSDLKIYVLHFSSKVDSNINENEAQLRATYKLPAEYYLVSNQFHNHKNHTVVLKALAFLKSKGVEVHIAFTGKMESSINHQYVAELKNLITTHALNNNISMLGVIPRNDQLGIMKYAKAIIQPSLFEGWSTVIEDAISLQVPVIASDLPVNIEQLGDKGFYFSPHDVEGLADTLASFSNPHGKNIYEKYDDRIRSFALNFIQIFDQQKKE